MSEIERMAALCMKDLDDEDIGDDDLDDEDLLVTDWHHFLSFSEQSLFSLKFQQLNYPKINAKL